jgi:peptidoglycan/LPS O-acetylase OafA/YrhL
LGKYAVMSIAQVGDDTMYRVTKSAKSRQRLAFLDALRGVAVLSVVAQHIGSVCSSTFEDFSRHHFGLGAFGVTIFFLCSGYIIPISLERHGSPRRFWLGRFRRLFPLYWCSLAATLLLAGVGRHTLPATLTFQAIIANAAMIQLFLGLPDALHVYWTLGYELLFYVLVSLLFIARLHRRTALLTFLLLLLPLVVGRLLPFSQGQPGTDALAGLYYTLGTMFLGTVAYRFHSGSLGPRSAGALALLAPVALLATLVPWVPLATTSAGGGVAWLNGQVLGWFMGYGVALTIFASRQRDFPRPLLFVGTISYSLYLFHALVVEAFPLSGPTPLRMLLWFCAIIILASATHRWIELPMMRWHTDPTRKSGRSRTKYQPDRTNPYSAPPVPTNARHLPE